MKKTTFAKIAVILFSMNLIFAADSSKKNKEPVGDDIFRSIKAEADDFYKISVEPSKKEIMNGVQSQLSDIKKQRLKLIRETENQKKSINETAKNNKKDLLDARSQMKKDLVEQRASVYGKPKSKKAEEKKSSEKAVAKSDNTKTEKIEKSEKKDSPEVKKEESTLEKAEDIRTKFIQYGLTLQGTRYVYGGTTPIPGMDCSGFVQYTAKNSVGVSLPRTAQNMYDASTKISQEEAIPGDLVFFRDGWKVSHVGIYLGNNQTNNEFRKGKIFLNAASGGPRTGVVVSGMNEPYWHRTFCGYGRILPKM